jgi:threonine/homoserine/homoserine lactone efflux protein
MAEQTNKPTGQDTLNAFTQITRAITRPAVTIIFAAVIAQVVTQGIDPPQWFLALASTCILWWFGDRTYQHIKKETK